MNLPVFKDFKWSYEDLPIEGVVRNTYINALNSADNNDYEPLMEFIRS